MPFIAPHKHNLKHSRLLELLRYDPDTGMFYHAITRNSKILAGSIAGYPRKHDGRRILSICDIPYFGARVAWFYMTGSWPKEEIDHINRDATDDRWCNLREATRSQNQSNVTYRNKTGAKGVYWDRTKKRFCAYIRIKGKTKHLGCYRTVEEAHAAYLKAAKEVHREFARV